MPPRPPRTGRKEETGELQVVPVKSGDERVGLLLLVSCRDATPFAMADDRLLSMVAAQLGLTIVVLSVREAESEKVSALGADNYLTKPFGFGELLARLRVALRHLARPGSGTDTIFRTGALVVDLEHRRVTQIRRFP